MIRSVRSELSPISAVARAMTILEELARAAEGLTASELSQRTGTAPSMASRILTTLLQQGYVVHDARSALYRLGIRTISICYRYADLVGFPEIATPALRRLADSTGELAQLAVVEGEDMWYVAKAEGSHRIRIVSLTGQKVVLHAMAAGRAWLAHVSEDRATELMLRQGIRRYNDRTIVSLDSLRDELRATRERGYAVNRGEVFDGAVAIACPIFQALDGVARVVGAVAVTGPAFRLEDVLAAVAPDVAKTAKELEAIWPTNISLRFGSQEAGAELTTDPERQIDEPDE